MLGLLKDIFKLGTACVTTYAICKFVDELIKPEESFEEIKYPSQHEKEEVEIDEVKKEEVEEKIVLKSEKDKISSKLGSIFRRKIEKSGIVINANDAIVKAHDTMDKASGAIENANDVLANANEAIQNINKTITKINNDIENAKRFIFVSLVFVCVYKLIK